MGVGCCILIPFNKNQAQIAVMDKSLMGLHFFPFFPQVTAGVPLPKEYTEEVTLSCCDSGPANCGHDMMVSCSACLDY